jgi:Skp family chaperone for outer membrane proteins
MKKVFFLCVALAVTAVAATNTQAQAIKIGTFEEQQVLALMPGIQKVDTLLQKFLADSLKPEYDYTLSELMTKDSTFKADSIKLQPGTRGLMQRDINQLKYKIVNWQQYQNEVLQSKQDEFLFPFKKEVYASLEKIIREQKYTHVLKNDAVLIAPPTDNLSIKVAIDLKLKFPKEVEDQLRAQGLLPSNAPAAPKTAPKTAPKN